MKPFVFHFTFNFEDTSVMYGFIGTPVIMEKLVEKAKTEWGFTHLTDTLDEDAWISFYDNIACPIEIESGDHSDNTLYDDRVESIGYDNGDMNRGEAKKVMNIWRKTFIDFAGKKNISKLVKIDDINTEEFSSLNDYEIYELINSKL